MKGTTLTPRARIALTAALTLVVIAFAGTRLAAQAPQLRDVSVDAPWLAVAALAYIVGVLACAVWWRVLLGAPAPPLSRTLLAYAAGTSGKYVPGKAATVALRAALVDAAPARAVSATLVEALSSMAMGALLAAALVGDATVGHGALLAGALLGCGAVAALVVPRLSARARAHVPPLSPRLLAWIPLTVVAWLAFGASAYACGIAVHAPLPSFLAVTGAVAAAVAAGFVVPVPAGVGARELALVAVLTQAGVDPGAATVVALALRATWLVVDVAMTAAGVPLLRRKR